MPFVGQIHSLFTQKPFVRSRENIIQVTVWFFKTSLMEHSKKGKRSKKICMTNDVSAFNLDSCALYITCIHAYQVIDYVGDHLPSR